MSQNTDTICSSPVQTRKRLESPLDALLPAGSDTGSPSEDEAGAAESVLEQFRRRGMGASLRDVVDATRIRTFLLDLGDDLAQVTKVDDTLRRMLEMALETSGITVQAPLPDSRLLGVHVPKKQDAGLVRVREFVRQGLASGFRVPAVLGEDYRGTPRLIDLARDCHQLVGGQTGSGKSMLLKATLLTMACCCPPEALRLIIVDGKGLDLSAFGRLPHSACPVITDPAEAALSLRWLVEEMERRRMILSGGTGPDMWGPGAQPVTTPDDGAESMPAIVTVIDEVQTLVNGAGGDADSCLRHISQRGRACGIFLILSTQRPSVDILQGSTKANIPGRISLRLPSQVDSRVILDQGGAELLRGAGDLIAIESSLGAPQRFQAPLVADEEIAGVCEYFAASPGNPMENLCRAIRGRAPEAVCAGRSSAGTIDIADANDDQANGGYPTMFAKVKLGREALEGLVAAEQPAPHPPVELVYLPFLHGTIGSGWRRRQILFEPAKGFFVASSSPVRTIPFWECTENLDGERGLLHSLIRARGPWSLASLGEARGVLPEVKDPETAVWRLIERGLAVPRSERFAVSEKLKGVPAFSGRLDMACLPERECVVRPAPHDLDKRIERLRKDLAYYWRAPLSAERLIGLPFHRVRGGTVFHVAAWEPAHNVAGLSCRVMPVADATQ